MTWIRISLVSSIIFFMAVSSSVFGEPGEVSCNEPVVTESGMVRGQAGTDTATCVWKGIPFASPPVGELRWKAPEPHPGWQGVRDAVEFSDICMQSRSTSRLEVGQGLKTSEDCLYLNIWRPRGSGSFPVMLWIYGGGYATGSGATPIYWGDRLAEFGEVVVVTFNYRLNVFGFLAHPELRKEDPHGGVGGYGILDQVAALRWVRDNIRSFGGDPDNVTIFGESAGGWAVCTLMATPLARGLFHRAIIESQGCEASVSLEDGYRQAADISRALGCGPDDLACLREVPAERLLKKTYETVEARWDILPNHDGYLLTDTPFAMIKSGDYNKVPLIAGSNKNEADALVDLMPALMFRRAKDYESVRLRSIPLTGPEAKELATLYPLSEHDGKLKKAYGQILSDALVSCPAYSGMAAVAKNQAGVYYYRFDYDGMRFGKSIGAVHAMEIAFVFDSFDRPPVSRLYNDKNIEEARALSKNIQSYWVNFARTGNPNGQGLQPWPEFSSENPARQILDTTIRTEMSDKHEKCEFWEKYNQNHVIPVRNLGK